MRNAEIWSGVVEFWTICCNGRRSEFLAAEANFWPLDGLIPSYHDPADAVIAKARGVLTSRFDVGNANDFNCL